MEDLFKKLTSSEEDNRPSEDKISKFDLSEEDCEIDEVHSVLEMAEDVLPKLDIVLKKPEAMETKLDNLGNFVKNVDAKVNALTTKVETLEATTRNAMKSIEELDRGLAFLNSEVEGLKKLERDCAALRQQVLYMGVYQRRENFRFYGIEEDPEGAEDTRKVLLNFLQSELDIDDASDIEFQRVHRIGRFNQQAPKPRQIIARFLRYPDRERVMSNAKKLKGKKIGISADLPKERRYCLIFLLQRRRESRLILVGRNPINCLLMADYFLLRRVTQTIFFLFLFPY